MRPLAVVSAPSFGEKSARGKGALPGQETEPDFAVRIVDVQIHQTDALPGAQCELPIDDRDGGVRRDQRRHHVAASVAGAAVAVSPAIVGGQEVAQRRQEVAVAARAHLEDGQACGGIGVSQGRNVRRYSAALGYWLGQRHWGQGLMTEVVAAYAPWVMEELGLARLSAQVMASNPRSARVLLKNGFNEEGTERQSVFKDGQLHDMRCFARLRTLPLLA